MALLPVDEALERVLDGVKPLEPECVPLREASGRVLASPIYANRTQPPFDASAMDGFAVRADDTRNPQNNLRVVAEAAAGTRFEGTLKHGETVRIFTGAPVPKGADAVLIQENTEETGQATIRATCPVEVGRNIRLAGLDFREGDTLLEPGRKLDPAALALAASGGHPSLCVHRKPLLAVLATGNELVPPGDEIGENQIIASNTFGIAAIAEQEGAEVLDLGIIPDDAALISAALQQASGQGADVLVTLGGASVGKHDLVRSALADAGMRLAFWKVAMRPGKPLISGRLGNQRVLGLPGNPVSSLVCAELFLRPLLARLSGAIFRPDIRRARLATAIPANDERQDYVRAVAVQGPEGLLATPFARQDSSHLTAYAAANCLLIRDPHAPAAAAGDKCRILMLRD